MRVALGRNIATDVGKLVRVLSSQPRKLQPVSLRRCQDDFLVVYPGLLGKLAYTWLRRALPYYRRIAALLDVRPKPGDPCQRTA